ncbi:lytic transglycosylase domain-containing protein [Croceicoccus mobilis]|uniref:Lytic transglycosylase n=1 Tax=Croceicoccus mobilis TaxID=1703339 RepID=A0A916YP86_9SPHN|nr:lytic transglycosylase domain-containing protein [Croceicoccus mobilis]GGD54896.1 lytic transglycosylase [Croceicoccus mobilis]
MAVRIPRPLTAIPALVAALSLAQPAAADGTSNAAISIERGAHIPAQLTDADRAFYREVFNQLDAENWGQVQYLLSQRPDGPLTQLALAEYYLAPNSPRIELSDLNTWLAKGRELPQAGQIGRLALKRGLERAPDLPSQQRLVYVRGPALRTRPRGVGDGTMPDSIAEAINDRIVNDDPGGARQLLDGVDATLSPAARAEWRQRVAWSHYIENDDQTALALARRVADNGAGPWVAEGWWVAGLAAWRLDNCELAADGFTRAAGTAQNIELRAAAHYWAARAFTRCRQPGEAAPALRRAAGYSDTLYGMLAAERLGMRLPQLASAAKFSPADWNTLQDDPNVRTAVALVEIGREGLADEVLRHQAEIGDAREYQPLARLARTLGLAGTQLAMSTRVPAGADPDPSTRFPVTRWAPVDGWRVDPALAYAHTLQESRFQPGAVSPAGAVGLMQITPITARQHAGLGLGQNTAALKDPATNMSYGQKNLEMLRDSRGTQGLLPKIMAAYNAGLSPITRWNTEINDKGDPLLWMESIPYFETRSYVAIVTRNYWMYQRQQNRDSDSREAYAQNLWPRFPGVAGTDAVAQHGHEVLSDTIRSGG